MSFYQTIDNNAPFIAPMPDGIMISGTPDWHPANTSYPHSLMLCSEFYSASVEQDKKLQ
jgi:hypothetical protein